MNFKARRLINILCIPVILSGIHLCFQGMETIKTANETYSWKTAKGTITYAGVQESSSSRTGKYKKPAIKYTYIANQLNYQGNTIYWGDDKSPNNVSYANDIVNKYKNSKQIIVYYHPLEPQKSVLETGTSEVTFGLLVWGGILIFIGTSIPAVFFLFRNLSTGAMKFKDGKIDIHD